MTETQGHISSGIWRDIRRWFGHSVRVLLPMACSAALLCWLFHKVSLGDMIAVVKHNVDYRWFGLLVVFNLLSYMIRGTRWGLQLGGVGIKVGQVQLWFSIFGAYALNLLFTGFGETWRCLFISRYRHAPLSTVIGTDIGDRMTDLVAVLLILGLTMVVADSSIGDFISRYSIGRDVHSVLGHPVLWSTVAIVLMACLVAGHMLKHYRVVNTIDNWIDNVWSGLKVVTTMQHKGRFAVLTLGIWICYFMQTYVCFFAFPFTRALITPELCYGLIPGLVALLFGSLSMAIPSSGGLGPWNLAIIFSLTLYGIGQTEATAFAMMAWGIEAALQVILGICTAIYVSRLPQPAAKLPQRSQGDLADKTLYLQRES